MSEGRRRGRPRNTVPLEQLDLLTLPQAQAYLRAKGQPVGRARLREAIVLGQLPALVDTLHHDRFQQPLFKLERLALDRWIRASLQPLRPTRIA